MPFQIRFHGTPHSDRIRSEAEGLSSELETEFPEVARSDLSINRSGEGYEANLHVTGRDVDLVGGAKSPVMREAVVDAFDKARRQLRKHRDKILEHRR